MNTTTKIAVAVLAGAVAGGTCPSDVNNDGTVGIQDFLQVLSDWGPCPSATVVDYQTLDQPGYVGCRLWSDNTLEIGADPYGIEPHTTKTCGIAASPFLTPANGRFSTHHRCR